MQCDVTTCSNCQPVLATPHVATAKHDRTLKFVPIPDLTTVDPVGGANRASHDHGYPIFDPLHGLDETFIAQPQMPERHTVENDGTLWTIRLREGLRFHDYAPALARDAG